MVKVNIWQLLLGMIGQKELKEFKVKRRNFKFIRYNKVIFNSINDVNICIF